MKGLRFDDVIGGIALFLLVFGGFWAAAGMGLPTGADQLVQEVP
ncbi:hypothetical protein [Tabrizicola fusiformis]|nr:hypothetical protein [Tabrizicola sp. SY72]